MPSNLDKPARKLKVKSGCRTCKLRKVKCDEGRPACNRCTLTGRICDGYGIWGGGNRPTGHASVAPPVKQDMPRLDQPVPLLVLAPAENPYFKWFLDRTSGKIPGTCMLSFWTQTLFQAGANESAVLHAILTLSSVHKRTVASSLQDYSAQKRIDDHDQFSLRQYSKTVDSLQPHFARKDRTSAQVALIACAVFICAELLRCNFATASWHLSQGFKILKDTGIAAQGSEGDLLWGAGTTPTEDSIIETFSRLQIQIHLFNYPSESPVVLLKADTQVQGAIWSTQGAWHMLDQIFYRIFRLTYRARPHSRAHGLEYERDGIRSDLSRWKETFDEFVERGSYQKFHATHDRRREDASIRLVYTYHSLASLMIETCLQAYDEQSYDQHTDKFLDLLTLLVGTYRRIGGNQHVDASHSITDLGWMAPLSYIARKCRIHMIRLHAVRLLECTSHREGIWDSELMGKVTRKVMEVEEGKYYDSFPREYVVPIAMIPDPQHTKFPPLPASQRLHDLRISLSGSPVDVVYISGYKNDCNLGKTSYHARYCVYIDQWEELC